jgi:hypothetical protein
MSESEGFWSYVHADDQAEGGRMSRLARDVRDQFQMLTGEPLDLFLDKDAFFHSCLDCEPPSEHAASRSGNRAERVFRVD